MDTVDKTESPPHIGCKPRLTPDVRLDPPPKPSPTVDRIYINHPQAYQHPDQNTSIFHILENTKYDGYIWGGTPFLELNKIASSPQ